MIDAGAEPLVDERDLVVVDNSAQDGVGVAQRHHIVGFEKGMDLVVEFIQEIELGYEFADRGPEAPSATLLCGAISFVILRHSVVKRPDLRFGGFVKIHISYLVESYCAAI